MKKILTSIIGIALALTCLCGCNSRINDEYAERITNAIESQNTKMFKSNSELISIKNEMMEEGLSEEEVDKIIEKYAIKALQH